MLHFKVKTFEGYKTDTQLNDTNKRLTLSLFKLCENIYKHNTKTITYIKYTTLHKKKENLHKKKKILKFTNNDSKQTGN